MSGRKGAAHGRGQHLAAMSRGYYCEAPSRQKSKLYRIWLHMRDRCRNPNNNRWENYGGKGVTVCEAWHAFWVFREWACAQLRAYGGDRNEISIDRVDSDGHYCPENCRLISLSENSRLARGS